MRKSRDSQFSVISACTIALILAVLHFDIALGQAPTAATGAATGVGETTATLNGTVNANGHATTVYFEVGQNTNYGATWQAVPSQVAGSTNTAVQAALSGLSANTTYHYRIVSVNPNGTTYGDDMTFTTLDATAIVVLHFQPRLSIEPCFWAAAFLIGFIYVLKAIINVPH